MAIIDSFGAKYKIKDGPNDCERAVARWLESNPGQRPTPESVIVGTPLRLSVPRIARRIRAAIDKRCPLETE